jgi:general secretion pathway protein G
MQAACLEPFYISGADMAKLARVAFCLQLFLLICCSKPNARENILRHDLFTIRNEIDQYTRDKQEFPQSLDDLVKAGDLKQLPEDPFTERRDTWVAEFSKDPKALGIINVRSGSDVRDKSGVPYKDW